MAGLPATATDKRFKRAHVKPARKRTTGAKYAVAIARWTVLLALLAYASYTGAGLVAAAPSLQIAHLQVRGNERLSTGEVMALVAGIRGQNILAARLDEWQQKLLSSPWVESASIRRLLPATVEVTVRERKPMGIGRIGVSMYLVDHRGMIIDEYGPAYADLDLPIIDGLAAAPRDGGSIIDVARAEFAASIIAALSARPDIFKQVSQIDVANLHDAVVILDGDPALLHIGTADYAARLQQYIELAPALRERVRAIDYVDLRFDERMYVRPAKVAAK